MKNLRIHFLNTIWSDAILLESNNHYAMVDTGSSFYYPMVSKHLNDFKIKKLDFILLTHFHNDHYGNVSKIINDYNVSTLYLKRYYGLDGTTSSGYSSNEEYIENEFKNYYEILESAKKNNTEVVFIDEFGSDYLEISLNDITLELYDVHNQLNNMYTDISSPFYQVKRFNENFNCLGIFIKLNQFNIFLGADVTCSSTDIVELKELSIKMINKIYQKHNINHIDIYKSCHHGGGGTNTLPLCKLLKAKYTIITNTARWLDTYDTFANLKEANPNSKILVTDYQKFIFNISDTINYQEIKEESLFITLKKD